MPISAVDAVTPAFHHTKQQLAQPFRAAQWAKLALVGFLAGEITSGGCSSPNFQIPTHTGGPHRFLSLGLPVQNPMLYAGLIAALIVAGLILFILFLYVSSVMRFVLFDSVVAKQCEIARGWNHRQGPGLRYFVWKLLFSFASLALFAVLIGIPAAFAFAVGWLKHPKEHTVVLILGGIVLFFVFLLCVLLIAVVQVLTKDFVVPQMALEDLGPIQAWSRLWPMINSEKGSYAGYLGMKLVMNLGAAVVLAIVAGIAILLLLIPVGGIGVIAVLAGKAAGLTWNLYTISTTVVVGSALILTIIYVVSLISVPATVFFPAYSIYFFAARYPRLAEILYPPIIPTPSQPLEPPPFLPPEPIA
ncbi:MAG: DUF7544 domain-containing protein [Terriglobales bacterium]